MIRELTNNNTLRFELNETETKRYQEFTDRVKHIQLVELEARKNADLDEDYLMKRSKDVDYSISLCIVPGSIGHNVYVKCKDLNLNEEITDYSCF